MSSQDYRRSQAAQRTIATVARQLEEVQRGAPLRAGGVGAGGITVKGGTIRVLNGGNLEVDGEATFGGDTTVGGNMRITGTLSLPAGIIDNDALSSPVIPATAGAAGVGGSVGTTEITAAVDTIAIPWGCTRALVLVTCSVSFSTNAPSNTIPGVRAYVAATGGAATTGSRMESNLQATNDLISINAHTKANYVGLTPGGLLTVAALARCTGGTISVVRSDVDAIITFLR